MANNYEALSTSELKEVRSVINAVLESRKKAPKVKKESKQTAYGQYTKKVCDENKEEYASFRLSNPGVEGAAPNFVRVRRNQDDDAEWKAFRDAWNLAHPKPAPIAKAETQKTGKKRGPKKDADCTPEELQARKEKREAKKAAKASAGESVPVLITTPEKLGLKKRAVVDEVEEPVKRSSSPEGKEKED
jgi:hypothetical protein